MNAPASPAAGPGAHFRGFRGARGGREPGRGQRHSIFGYAVAHALTEVLKRCGDDLSRSCVSRQAQSLRNLHIPVMLPSIVVNISPTDYHPIKQMRLVQFDGRTWQSIGDVIDSAFVGSNGR